MRSVRLCAQRRRLCPSCHAEDKFLSHHLQRWRLIALSLCDRLRTGGTYLTRDRSRGPHAAQPRRRLLSLQYDLISLARHPSTQPSTQSLSGGFTSSQPRFPSSLNNISNRQMTFCNDRIRQERSFPPARRLPAHPTSIVQLSKTCLDSLGDW